MAPVAQHIWNVGTREARIGLGARLPRALKAPEFHHPDVAMDGNLPGIAKLAALHSDIVTHTRGMIVEGTAPGDVRKLVEHQLHEIHRLAKHPEIAAQAKLTYAVANERYVHARLYVLKQSALNRKIANGITEGRLPSASSGSLEQLHRELVSATPCGVILDKTLQRRLAKQFTAIKHTNDVAARAQKIKTLARDIGHQHGMVRMEILECEPKKLTLPVETDSLKKLNEQINELDTLTPRPEALIAGLRMHHQKRVAEHSVALMIGEALNKVHKHHTGVPDEFKQKLSGHIHNLSATNPDAAAVYGRRFVRALNQGLHMDNDVPIYGLAHTVSHASNMDSLPSCGNLKEHPRAQKGQSIRLVLSNWLRERRATVVPITDGLEVIPD